MPAPPKAASTLALSSTRTTVAATIKPGTKVAVKGTITSNYNITSVQVGIQNNTGAWVSGYPVTRYPNSTSYNLANVDASIKFNTLSAGVYRFIVIASDGYPTNNKTLQAITFVVSAPPAPVEAASTLALSSTRTTIASTINSGALVAVKGTITSNYNITNVQVGFKNSSGAWISGYPASRYPNAKSYDLKNVDSDLILSNPQKYSPLMINLENSGGTHKVLVTGYKKDASGNLIDLIVVDPAKPNNVPIDFANTLRGGNWKNIKWASYFSK